MSGRRRRRWPWVLGALLAAGVGVAVVARGSDGGDAPIDGALVVPVKRVDLAVEIVESGKIDVRERVELKSRVAGQVAEVHVDEGAPVKKGQLLITLDPVDYQRDVARASAELSRAKAAVTYAKRVLERMGAGVTGNVVAAQELDAARHRADDTAIAVRLAEVALAVAQDRLRYTKIESPIDGTVIQRNIQPGEVVTPGVESTFDGRSLLTVADLSTLVVKAELNQIDVARVRLGQVLGLTLDAIPGKTYRATITKISPASVRLPNREVDVFPVEAEIGEVDGQLKPGMTADVRLLLEQKPGVLALPIESVVRQGEKSWVSRVTALADGKTRVDRVEVTTGLRNDREVELLAGVAEGDQVLIDPPPATENELKL